MKKILSKLYLKKKTIFKYIFLFCFVLIWNLFIVRRLDGDEIWNYGFSNNFYMGLIPYKDFNMVITPLFPALLSLPYYIFGSNILVFHIMGSLIITIMMYFTNKLLLNKKSLIILLLMFFPVFNATTNYNIFTLFIFVLIIWCEKNKKNDFLIGFLLGCMILTKQTVGICLLIPSIFCIKINQKKLKRLIGVLVPCILFFIYLVFNNALYQFINLCFLGLLDFNSTNGNYDNIFFYLTILLVLYNIYLIIKNKNNIYYYYSLCYLIIIFPLFDFTHFFIGITAFCIVYLLDREIKPKMNISLFVYSILTILTFFYFFQCKDTKITYPNNINHFQYKLINNDSINITNKVNMYLDENANKKIIFLFGNQAYYFKIIHNQKVGYIDLVNDGNLGYKGTKKILNYIKKNKDALYIINRGEQINNMNNQVPKSIYNYVIKSSKIVDSISEKNIQLDVYSFEKENAN